MKAPRCVAWGVVALCLWPWQPRRSAQGPLLERLVGPVASLVASAEWVRFDVAVREGRYEAAYARAERALDLDPHAPGGWVKLAMHLATFRASLENEPDAGWRRRWIRAGLDLLERGEESASDPAELALTRGLLLTWVATVDTPSALGWPGGRPAAAREAESAFLRAAELGLTKGALLAERAREPDFGLPEPGVLERDTTHGDPR